MLNGIAVYFSDDGLLMSSICKGKIFSFTNDSFYDLECVLIKELSRATAYFDDNYLTVFRFQID